MLRYKKKHYKYYEELPVDKELPVPVGTGIEILQDVWQFLAFS